MQKEFILLLAFASIVNIAESQAAQLKCPTPKSMEVHKLDKTYLYQGTSISDEQKYKVPFEGTFTSDESKSKLFKLHMIYKTESNQLACYYLYNNSPHLIEIKTSDKTANANCERKHDDDMFFTCE